MQLWTISPDRHIIKLQMEHLRAINLLDARFFDFYLEPASDAVVLGDGGPELFPTDDTQDRSMC